jgi:hypothetical protein
VSSEGLKKGRQGKSCETLVMAIPLYHNMKKQMCVISNACYMPFKNIITAALLASTH